MTPMTSDGIADADWDRVHELAVVIVNCSADEEEAAEACAIASLFALLGSFRPCSADAHVTSHRSSTMLDLNHVD
jgi:hypothetical protein